jgi:hypothetical protein
MNRAARAVDTVGAEFSCGFRQLGQAEGYEATAFHAVATFPVGKKGEAHRVTIGLKPWDVRCHGWLQIDGSSPRRDVFKLYPG